MTRLRALLVCALVLLASLAGGLAATTYTAERSLDVGRVSLSTYPFHHGTLDVYVPVLDWGVRLSALRFPARLVVEVRTIDRKAAARVARNGLPAAAAVRADARTAIASYLRILAVLTAAAAFAAGSLTALALRGTRFAPRLRWMIVTAAVGGLTWALWVALLVAPRGTLAHPRYFARGADIPVALRALQSIERTPNRLSEEIDDQLVGLARLVLAPGERPAVAGLPRFTVASDIHNNALAVPVVRRAAAGGPLLVPGDLADRGTPFESGLVASIAHAGRPVVVTSGNHDSDASMRRLARAGAIVLTQRGRLEPDGRLGPVVVRVGGLRVAGYASPNERRARERYRDRGAAITPAEQAAFTAWIEGLLGKVDVVLVHEPALAAPAVARLRTEHLVAPLLIAEGHTHRQAVESAEQVTLVNGGTAGGGGTGNLDAQDPIGLAQVTYARGRFAPLAVDLVEVAPGTGSGEARRVRLDSGPVRSGDPLAPSPEVPDAARPANATTATNVPRARP